MTRPPRRRSLHDAADKLDGEAREQVPGDGAAKPGKRRSFNEAAHKLGPLPGYREPVAEEVRSDPTADAIADQERDVIAHASRAVLALGALGVVYGDIGTSPLYTEQFIFTEPHGAAHATQAGVFGVVSLIFWALMIEVSIKYAGFIMRAHNRGDGGIMALTALIMRKRVGRTAALVLLGIFGAALFFGDGMITPAISVLGALQGLQVDAPALGHLIVPLSLAILIGLFVLQRRGSGTIGWVFGPVMVVWFVAIGALGAREVFRDPAVFQALSPSWGARFLVAHGSAGFLILGGVVLAVTGAEALYADRGHFGSNPIRLGWFGMALPALVLNYLGQGVLIIHSPRAVANPFFLMIPGWGRFPMLLLATAATIIASQAVISGSFSVAKQAVQLGFLPRLKIQHTSKQEGQIYVPFVNWGLCIGVGVLVVVFKSSNRLGDMYGVAVTGTFILNTLLFLAVARSLWGTSKWKLTLMGALFLTVEIAFFSSNLAKIAHGAWLPLAVVPRDRRGDDHLAQGRRTGNAQPHPAGRRSAGVSGAPGGGGSRGSKSAGHRDLPESRSEHDAARAARVGRARSRDAREGPDRLGRDAQRPSLWPVRPLRRRAARSRPVSGLPRDRANWLSGRFRRARSTGAVSQTGPARSQPRPRARLLLRLAHHDHTDRGTGDGAVAQAGVHHDGP